MVAKSYQTLEQFGEPYTINGRKYVKVRTNANALKQVRWYTESEYAKMYGEPVNKAADTHFKTRKELFGFDKGYITIFKGAAYEDRDYFKQSIARYCKLWGWYVVSTDEVMTDLPEDVEAVQLPWEVVGNEDGSLKSDAEVEAAVEPYIYGESTSEYQGEIGEKVDVYLTVNRVISMEGYYGTSLCHKFYDDDGNAYSWITSAKNLPVGETYHIKGTIKDLRSFHGEKTTILTRCRVVED